MHTWFECTVAFDRTGEDGLIKKSIENYLVDALSFTEADERITREALPFATGEFMVAKVKRVKIQEIYFNEGSDRWYRCRVCYHILDEDRGIEKKSMVTMMVQANNVAEAVVVLHERMKGSLGDYELTAVSETNILDVYPYQPLEN